MKQRTPIITQELIDYLTTLHPLRSPDPLAPDREIWIEAGRQKLIAHLKTLYEQQNKRGEIINV